MAVTRIPPGWNASGKQITDPVAFIDSILVPIIEEHVKDGSAASTYDEFQDQINENTNQVILSKNDYHEILTQSASTNAKDYQFIPSLGLTRLSADANGNCFFDSFLTLMSPSYRNLSIRQRKPVMSAFRKWCADNASKIIRSIPKSILSEKFASYSDTTGDKIKVELNRRINTNILVKEKNASGKNVNVRKSTTIDKEIDFEVGYLIAWYFGINLVFFATPGNYDMNEDSKEYEALCNTAYQSTSCKVGFIAFSGNHFEPIIQAAFTSDKHLDEGSSTFLFEWTNPILCKIKNAANRCKDNAVYGETYSVWEEPGCADAGGRHHRPSARVRSARVRSAHHRRQSKLRRTKRRSTRKRRAY